MAIIHSTTLNPEKLELLTSWLPDQPWYLETGRVPELTEAGGFRLDDPQGEVGIEFMLVNDGSGERSTTYQVPMSYRAQALAGADGALIGTAEHGVLGHRWIYDAAHDPVLIAPLVALIQGDAEPQAQNVSNTADPTVISQPVTDGSLTALESVITASAPSGTDLQVDTANAEGMQSGQLIIRINRILRSGSAVPASESGQPCLSATWQLPDGTDVRGIIATAQYTQARPARP
jgi:Maltokinase N-terminal cap domain